jgi:hypothetical protein
VSWLLFRGSSLQRVCSSEGLLFRRTALQRGLRVCQGGKVTKKPDQGKNRSLARTMERAREQPEALYEDSAYQNITISIVPIARIMKLNSITATRSWLFRSRLHVHYSVNLEPKSSYFIEPNNS